MLMQRRALSHLGDDSRHASSVALGTRTIALDRGECPNGHVLRGLLLGSNAVENRRTTMTAVPVEPGERDRARAARTVPAVAVHSRQTARENMDGTKSAVLE